MDENKTILITGSSSGIGKATVLYFAQKGWNVAATMQNPEKAPSEFKNLKNVRCYSLDVTNKDSIAGAINSSIQDFGRIDVLVNNAGYAAIGPLEYAKDENIKKQFDVNVFGVMDVCRVIVPYFRENGGGMIINVSSIGGRITFPIYSLYHSTKFAIEGFTESLSHELRKFKIKLALIEHGPIRTDFYDRSMTLMSKEGLDVYDTYFHKVNNNMDALGKSAPLPIVVARTIYRSANSNSSFKRYVSGGINPTMLIFLRKICPNWFFNFMLRLFLE